MINWITTAFYVLGIASAILIFISIVTAFMGKPSWGQMRVMGVTLALFGWINAIFYFSVFQAAFGIISVILNLPIWMDIILFVLLLGAASFVFIKLSERSTFKPEAFIAVVLIPLSLSGVKIVGTAAKEGSLLVPKYGWMMLPKAMASEANGVSKMGLKDLKEAPKLPLSRGQTAEKVAEEVPTTKKIDVSKSIESITERPNWRQSEKDIGQKFLDEGYTEQISFKDGKQVVYGTKGSTRPDWYKEGSSIEIKNYDLQTVAKQKSLIENVTQQAVKRSNELSEGTVQSLYVDVRGQQIDRNTLESITEKIDKESKGLIKQENIRFLR